MRGKAAFMAACILRVRITPACAGKREKGLWRFCEYKDHPRVCGEKGFIELELRKLRGSPPRVRGKGVLNRFYPRVLRITPACAGKSHRAAKRRWVYVDHPRVCGEKYAIEMVLLKSFRITPACAGKRLKKAHKIKDFDPVPIRFHLVFRRFERWCSNLPTPDGNVPV